MQKAKRLLSLLLSVLMVLSVLSGCSGKEEKEPALELRAAVCPRIASLDPAMNTERTEQTVFYLLYENLLRLSDDGTGCAVPDYGVAREYKEEPNYDGTVTYTFKLRSSANWSDGTRVKAKDFVYAWRRLVDPKTESPNHAMLSMVKGYDTVRKTGNAKALAVSAENDSTFTVTLSAPCAYFLNSVCTAVATMPLREDVVSADKEGWANSANLLSNGAYQISVWTADEFLQLRRNENYYESKLIGADMLRLVFAADASEQLRLYEEGKVDYIADPPRDALAEDRTYLPRSSTYCLLYNNVSDLFHDADVRRAFDLSIDRSAAATAAGAGAAPATGLVSTGIESGAEGEEDFRTLGGELCAVDSEGYAERCAEANECLKRAGFSSGRDFPPIELLYVEGDRNYDVVWALQRMWSEQLGVSVLPRALSREDFDERLASGDFEIAADEITTDIDDATGFLERFSAMGPENKIKYKNETYEVLLGVAGASENMTARAAFLHDAEALLLEDAALSPLYFDTVTDLLRDNLQGIYHDHLGRVFLKGVTRVEAAA